MPAALRTILRSSTAVYARTLHTSAAVRVPYKDSQDRNTLQPGTNENTKSGRDDEVARDHPEAAFDPRSPSPEEAHAQAQRRSRGGNPLEASGANQEFNKPMGDEKTPKKYGAGQEVSKGGTSKGKSAPKKGKLPRD